MTKYGTCSAVNKCNIRYSYILAGLRPHALGFPMILVVIASLVYSDIVVAYVFYMFLLYWFRVPDSFSRVVVD